MESSIETPRPHPAQTHTFYDNFPGSYNWKECPPVTKNLLRTYDKPAFK